MIGYEYTYEAFRNVPAHVEDNEHFQKGVDYLAKVIESYEDNYVDTNSEHYAMLIHEAEEDGAVAVQEKLLKELKLAQYRRDLFGEEFDLDGFVERVEKLEDLVYG